MNLPFYTCAFRYLTKTYSDILYCIAIPFALPRTFTQSGAQDYPLTDGHRSIYLSIRCSMSVELVAVWWTLYCGLLY